MAYEWLSRNAKSGYFVLNFDTQSVKLGFKNWLKNAPIFPISGGPVTFRPSLTSAPKPRSTRSPFIMSVNGSLSVQVVSLLLLENYLGPQGSTKKIPPFVDFRKIPIQRI